jgi:hypothetical protein
MIYDDYSNVNGECDNGHPKLLGIEDYSKIIGSESFFARKFELDSEILDMLDSHILSQN